MIYSSKDFPNRASTNAHNGILQEFRNSDRNVSRFLTAMFWNDLWIHDDEMARRNHATKVIERWGRVFSDGV